MTAWRAHPAFRFCVVGLVNTVAGLVVIVFAAEAFGAEAYFSNAAGLLAGIVIGYQLNRHWTFASQERASVTAPRYLLAFAGAYMTNIAVLTAGLSWFTIQPLIAHATALLAYSIVFYLLCRRVVFRNKS